MMTEAPVIGTGIETTAAVDSGVCIVAAQAGVIARSTSKEIVVKMCIRDRSRKLPSNM